MDHERRTVAPPAEEPLPFGQALRESRQTAGLTQEALAERAGLSPRTIQHLERGATRPYRHTVGRLAKALALSAEARQRFEAAAPSAPRRTNPAGRLSRRAQDRTARVPAATAASRLAGPLAPGPPLAGRADELALLGQHLRGDGPPVLLLAGEPGMGKSRLIGHAAQHAEATGWTLLWGGCQRQGGQDPYTPLVDALARYLTQRSVDQQQGALEDCAWLVRLLPEVAAGPIEPLPAWTLSPAQERRLVFAAVTRFLANVAGPSGTMLLLDDLQWAGGDALDLLRTLAHDAAQARLRVIGAYRNTEAGSALPLSTFLADLAYAGLARQHTLPPLPPEEAAHLLRAVLAEGEGSNAGPEHDPRLSEEVLRRAGGVPFFLISCAHALRQGPRDARSKRSVPWDVAQGVRQRVAALPEVARDLLGVAAVIGRVVPHALLAAVTPHPEGEILAALDALCQAHLLEDSEGYRFTHDLIRETLEADLGTARRSALHRRVAQALEQGPEQPSPEIVAYHYGHTGEHARAALWLERAGDSARAEFATAAALAHYMAARQHLQRSAAEVSEVSGLDEKLGDVHLLMGACAEARDDFARARARATGPVRRAELACKEADAWQRQGELAHALAALADAEAEGAHIDGGAGLPAPLAAVVEALRGEVHRLGGAYDAAATAVERALVLLDGAAGDRLDERALASALHLQGRIALDQGELSRAEESHRRSLALHERLGDPRGIAECWFDLGRPLHMQGHLAQAEECWRRSLALYERLGDQQGIGNCWHGLGDLALRQRGDLDDAEQCFRRRLLGAEMSGDQQGIADAWSGLAGVAFARGEFARAEECQQRSLVLADRCGYHWGAAGNRVGLGDVARVRGELALAEEFYRQSLSVFEPMGTQWIIVLCWHSLGEVACERGDLNAAVRWHRQARRRARAMGLRVAEAYCLLGQARACLRGGRLRFASVLLEHASAVIAVHEWRELEMQAALVTGELRLRQGAITEARIAAEQALQLAAEGGRRADEAVARRLLGQCALARGSVVEGLIHLRTAVQTQVDLGTALEAARTRLLIATALTASAPLTTVPDDARVLLADARAQFAASGATLDLAQAERIETVWSRQ